MEVKDGKLEKVLVTDEPSQIEKIAKYDGMRPNETHVSTTQVPHPKYGSVYVHHFSSDDSTNARHLVSMFHDPTRHGVSILLAARENEDEPMRVYAAATHPNFRGNRLNYLALKEAVKSHGKLYSDVMQTKGAFKNWTNLQKEPGFKVNMTKPFREGSTEDASLQSHIAQFNPALLRRSEDMYKSLYSPYEELEKSEKLPHYLKFMGDHPKAQEIAQWADDNLKHRNLAEFAMRHAKSSPDGLNDEHKSTIKHFNDSLHMPEVQKAAGMLTSKHDFNSGVQLLKDAEAAYQKRHAEEAPKLVPMEGEKVLDFGDGVAVYNLGKGKNANEATAMGHCATPHEGGELWSIRKDHGNGMVEPLVTISHEKGYIGEMKGKHNWKPSTKHHGHISKLLASDIIKGFVGGGYAPESNFEFSDLSEGLRKKLLDYKPALTQKVYKETLPKGFQDYSHTPEIKSIFNSNDAEAQRKYLSKYKVGSWIHENAAQNPNIHPDVLRKLIQKNAVGSWVHKNAARNPNIHPEDLQWLIQNHTVGSDVHGSAALNPNIHPDVLRKLIQDNKVGSWIHENAALNPNIHPDVLRKLIQDNKVGSWIHENAARNPQFKNLPPEIQQIVKPPRPLQKENIQKLISIMNDENNPQLARQAHEEIKKRRKEKYDKILSPEGNIEDIQHLAESHDEEMSKRAKEELKRRGLRKSQQLQKAVTPEQQKENIKKQRQLKNKEIIAKLKSKVVDKESSAAPSVKPHLLMPKDDSPHGIPVYLKTHKDHDSLAGVHVHVSELPNLKNYGLLDHPEIDKALDRAEERGHRAVYVSTDSKPTIELRPQPNQDFDVDPEILESMKERLKPQKPKSHLKLIKALWSAPKVVGGQYAKPFSMGGTKKEKKTIYSHFSHPEHAKFNAQEHLDAYWRHQDKIKQNPKMEPSLVNFHKQQAQQHWDKSRELVDKHDISRRIEENKPG